MPSLNLRNPLRRDPNRTTLKQRAAALKATAAKIVRKPKLLPPAGSREAVEAFGAACRAVDAASRLNDPEMEALHIMPGGPSFWTSDTVTAALSGDFSRLSLREIEAARATPRARLEEVQILALRRELRMAEAARSSRIRELHALVYGDEPDPDDGSEAPAPSEPDPIFALIEANRKAEAKMDAFGKEAPSSLAPPDLERQAALEDAQVGSWKAAFGTPPTTLAGIAALREWITWQIGRHKEQPQGDGTVWADAYLSLHAALDLVLRASETDAELIALGRAFDVAAARAMDAADVLEATPGDAEKELDAANEAAEAAFALAEQLASLPVHSLAGIQAKLRVAAFYGTCSPHEPLEGERTGEIAIRSLYRSTPGMKIGTTASDTRIVPEA